MKTEILKEQNLEIWRIEDELGDISSVKEVVADFKSSGLNTVILDLTGKEWVSSSEIGVIMWIYKELGQAEGVLQILTDTEFVLKTLTVTGLDQLLPIFPDINEALNNQRT